MPKNHNRVGKSYHYYSYGKLQGYYKKTPSQPGGLTRVFVQSSKPTITRLREWLLKEYGVKSGAGDGGFIIENC